MDGFPIQTSHPKNNLPLYFKRAHQVNIIILEDSKVNSIIDYTPTFIGLLRQVGGLTLD